MAVPTSRRSRAATAIAFALAAAAALAAGCAPSGRSPQPPRTNQRPAPPRAAADAAGPQQPSARPDGNNSPTAAGDACAARLHDISGLLLLYFVSNQRLPERLEELAPLSDSPSTFQAICPASGRPYAYTPQGLPGAGTDRVLLVYDETPAHGGFRWVIVASPPQGDQPLRTFVMPYTDQKFGRHRQ